MTKSLLLAISIGALVLTAPGAALAGEARMTTEELTALISGNTVYGTSSNGSAFIQIFGADGYSKKYPIERMFRDSRGWPIAGGTVQIQRINIAGAMLGRRFNQR